MNVKTKLMYFIDSLSDEECEKFLNCILFKDDIKRVQFLKFLIREIRGWSDSFVRQFRGTNYSQHTYDTERQIHYLVENIRAAYDKIYGEEQPSYRFPDRLPFLRRTE